MKRLRQSLIAMSAFALVFALVAAPGGANAQGEIQVNRPDVVPLPDHLEQIRASEATELYGSPEIRDLEDRDTSLVSMGDSEISGEGVGNYDPDTDREGNWCHRSYDQAMFRTDISSDEVYNLACSGAQTPHLIEGSGASQWDELNQGDNLAIKARNTNVKMIFVAVGANDQGGVEFGPTMSDCVTNRVLFQGPCWPDYTDDWAARVSVTQEGIEESITAIRGTMTGAGYLESDYELVYMSYPSPMSPDVEDNPDFPGWYDGGCLGYLEDQAFARNKAVAIFQDGVRQAALNKDVRYLDLSRLFDGHAVCSENPWARGLYIDWDAGEFEHMVRQSFHPNYRGHGAFADCISSFYANPDWQNGTCVDVNYTGDPEVYEGFFEFQDVVDDASGYCMDAEGYNSRYSTPLVSWDCHGGRNQGFRYDEGTQTIQIELSQARCVDAEGGEVAAGTNLILWKCTGTDNQLFTVDGDKLRSTVDEDLCVAFPQGDKGSQLTLESCAAAGTDVSWLGRDYDDPVGYGYDDWMGSDVY